MEPRAPFSHCAARLPSSSSPCISSCSCKPSARTSHNYRLPSYSSPCCSTTKRAFRKLSCIHCSAGDSALDQSWNLILDRRTFTRSIAGAVLLALGHDLATANSYARGEGSGTKVEDELQAIQLELRKVLKRPKAAGILRLVFHDAGTYNATKQTGGMNGSIRFELDRLENSGLDRSLKILGPIKASLDSGLRAVSWADLIAVAGAEAVAVCGGPRIPVKLGRLDVVIPDPEGELPSESSNAFSLKTNFLKKGFTTRELVVLSGAHTLGSKGFGNPLVFDNAYFKVLLQKPWTQTGNEMGSMTGLPSDRSLLDDEECLRWINCYANDQSKFFEDFSAAYLKLVDSGALWRTEVA